jgi:hypothetical protein
VGQSWSYWPLKDLLLWWYWYIDIADSYTPPLPVRSYTFLPYCSAIWRQGGRSEAR